MPTAPNLLQRERMPNKERAVNAASSSATMPAPQPSRAAQSAIIRTSPLTVAVPSNTHHDLNYVVTLLDDGSATCDCPGFRFHSRHIPGFTCRHIVNARAEAISTLPTPLRPAPKPSWTASQNQAWDECLGFAANACEVCGVALAADCMMPTCMAHFSSAALGSYSASDFMPLARLAVR